MPFRFDIDIVPVLGASFITFSLLALWFSPALFGRVMQRRRPAAEIAPSIAGYLVQVLFLFLYSLFLHVLVDSLHVSGLVQGIRTGLAAGLFISTARIMVTFPTGRAVWLEHFIYSGYFFAASVISASLQAMWR